jgi:hypothetical protein
MATEPTLSYSFAILAIIPASSGGRMMLALRVVRELGGVLAGAVGVDLDEKP